MCVCVCVCVCGYPCAVVHYLALSIEDQEMYLLILEGRQASRVAQSHFYLEKGRDVLRVPGTREGEADTMYGVVERGRGRRGEEVAGGRDWGDIAHKLRVSVRKEDFSNWAVFTQKGKHLPREQSVMSALA